jgi:hypothetical protein
MKQALKKEKENINHETDVEEPEDLKLLVCQDH